MSSLSQMLTDDERAKADGFRVTHARRSYVVARAVLRTILARYLDLDPRRITIGRGPFGKPRLGIGRDEDPLRFNVSHSHELALCAVTMNREVGIDVEHLRPVAEKMEIAERFFSVLEVAALRALAPDSREEAFFGCWVRKEAYLKARGIGLSTPDPQDAAQWSMHPVNPGPGYVAALAVEGKSREIKSWSWSD